MFPRYCKSPSLRFKRSFRVSQNLRAEVALLPSVKNFLKADQQLLIDGKWTASVSGKTFTVLDPATEEVIAKCAEGNKEDVDRAVKAARKAFDENSPWRKMGANDRAKIINRFADLLEKNTEEFAQLESLDNGKPYNVAKAADVPLAVDQLRYYAGWATKIAGSTFPINPPYTPGTEYFACTVKEPVGVAGQIIPWNFPLLMAAWKLAPALAAGCTVVLKPAEQTPLTALRLGQLSQEAGFPDGVLNIITGDGVPGAAIAGHPLVDKVAFTGSTEVGKLIVNAASGNLKKVTLELGGKSPNIVFGDADVKSAIAGSRLFIQENIYDEVVAGIAEAAKAIKLGRGLDDTTQMGPMVSAEQHQKVLGLVELGKKQGAKAVAGGEKGASKGYFVKPTVFTNTKDSMDIIQQEIFGPVVCAIPFKDTDDLIARANDSIYGLAAAVWTKDLSKALGTAKQLKAGTVWVNTYNIFDAALPFGGYKQSGWGREMGEEALSNYVQVKSICVKIK